MSYEVSVSECGRFVICRVDGPVTLELTRDFVAAASRAGRERGVLRYLFDKRTVPNTDSVLNNYKFANEEIPKLDIDRAARAAVVVNPDDRSHDFIVTATRNAGYNIRLFDDWDAAVLWLNE